MLTDQQLNTAMSSIKAGILSVHAEMPDADTLAHLLKRVNAGLRNRDSQQALLGYAYKTGRNWAISAHNKQRRQRDAEQQVSVYAQAYRITPQVRREFWDLSIELAATSRTASQLAHLDVLGRMCIEGQGYAELAEFYPDVKKNTLEQWKRRGIKRVLPYASPALREILLMCHAGSSHVKPLAKGEAVVIYDGPLRGRLLLSRAGMKVRRSRPRLKPNVRTSRRRTR